MKREPLPLQHLCDIAIDAARAAGQLIQRVDHREIQRRYKDAGSSAASQLVTEVDLRSEAIIREHLLESCQHWDIAFVGEESLEKPPGYTTERFAKPFFWCVDPLDGTLPYVEGVHGYAVSIALVAQSGLPLIGVVFDPAQEMLIHAIKDRGAYRNQSAICPVGDPSTSLVVYADASLKAEAGYDGIVDSLNRCAYACGLDGVEFHYGYGAVKNACKVLDGSAACYLKLPKPEDGGGSIWDFAATACIVREAGAWASNIYGGALDINRRGSTFMNHQGVVFASSEQIARCLMDSLSVQLPPQGATT